MNLPEFSVKRRITITMLIMIAALFGVVSFFDLGLDMMPEMDMPFVTVVTGYPGVSPEEIETLITKPVEQMVATVKGVKKLSASSVEGMSMVSLEFEWGTNLDFAAQDIREKLSFTADMMPREADTPLVLKFDTSSMPVMQFGAVGLENTLRLRKFLDDTIKPRLERLDGVASVEAWGGRVREIHVLVDPDKLKATGMSLDHISRAIQSGNLNLAGGHIQTLQKEYTVRTQGYFESLDEIRNTTISMTQDGKSIHVGDVADVVDTFNEIRGFERTNKQPTVVLVVMKQSGANSLKTTRRVQKELDALEGTFPPGFKLYKLMDQGEMVEDAISLTGWNAVLGGIVAVFVVFIFLRAIRPTLTIAVAIPLSIVTTFIGMKALGYTFNMMTLGGLALGVGLLVDNAVVVIENTFRHLEGGDSREESAIKGASEVGLAITASTLTTMAVFLPMSLSQSMAGKLARPLSLTVCVALLASLFVAITIIPAIAATIFKRERYSYDQLTGKGWMKKTEGTYARILDRCLKHRWMVLIGAFLALAGSIVLTPSLGTEFMPPMEIPFTAVSFTLPEGSILQETDHIAGQIEDQFLASDGITLTIARGGITSGSKYSSGGGSGVNGGIVYARFKDREDRNQSADEIIDKVRDRLPDLEGVDFRFIDMGAGSMGSSGAAIEVNFYGRDLDVLDRLSTTVMERLESVEGVKDLEKSLKKRKHEIHITVDREKASQMGLSVYQIASTVEMAMRGKIVSRYHEAGDEHDIRVRFQEPYRRSLRDLEKLTIQSPLGFNVPLSQVTKLTKDFGPITINRKNQDRVVSVTGSYSDRDLGSILKDINGILGSIDMPEGYFADVGGAFEDMQSSFQELTKAFLIAVLLIYMVMAAQFESFAQPFIVMFTLPLAYIGVVVGLVVTGKTMSVPAFMGLIILMGIVVNNGIVMIDYINRLRREGMERIEAIVKAASVRLRPILITSITTICGMLPMALSTGEGSEMRSPMAVAVASGLLFAMVFTLFVVPAAYSVIDAIASRISRKAVAIVVGEE